MLEKKIYKVIVFVRGKYLWVNSLFIIFLVMFKIALMIFLYIFCKFIGIICILRDALSEIKNIKIVVKMIKNLVIKL